MYNTCMNKYNYILLVEVVTVLSTYNESSICLQMKRMNNNETIVNSN